MESRTLARHGITLSSLLIFFIAATFLVRFVDFAARTWADVYYKNLSREDVFIYYNVVPANKTPVYDESEESAYYHFEIGEDILMRSDLEPKMPVYFKYNDILRCGTLMSDGRRPIFSSQKSEVNAAYVSNYQTDWYYTERKPETPKTCYFQHEITGFPHPDHKYHQTIFSPEFKITLPEGY